MLYQNYETEISQNNLTNVFSKIKEPICLLGGWAVYLTVNKNFEKSQGRSYIGSKDIDIGFHLEKQWSNSALSESVFFKSIKALKDDKFIPVGFRFVKHYHTETKAELSEGEMKKIPLHLIFEHYVDPIVDIIHPNSKSILGFVPIDEPLLSEVFSKKKNLINEFGVKIILPSTDVLLATKLNSVCNRDKEHKKIKDISDIYALIWYSDSKPQIIKTNVRKILNKKKIAAVISSFSDEDYDKVSKVLEINKNEITKVIKSIMDDNDKSSIEKKSEIKERWGPTNVGYDSFKKILSTLHILHADTKRISLDSIASSSGFKKTSVSSTIFFRESIGVVGTNDEGISMTPRGQAYIRAVVEDDSEKIKTETKKIVDNTFLNKLKNFVTINKSDLTLEKLYKHVQSEARFGPGAGPFGLHQPHATAVKTLLQIMKDSGYLPHDFYAKFIN